MNLERVEELCLNYLRQSENPLVSVSKLLAHCQRDPACAHTNLGELLAFLRAHGQIHVMEGPDAGEAVDAKLLQQAGLDMGARAILDTRSPSKKEIAAMMGQQIEVMTTSLASALDEARKQEDLDREKQLTEALARAQALRERMQKFYG